MKSSLRARIWQQAVVAIVIIAAICTLMILSYSRVAEANRWVLHTQRVLASVEELLTALVDAETGQRGYLLTGDQQYLEPYARALNLTPRYMQELSELTADDTLQVARLTRTQVVIDHRFDLLAASVAHMNKGNAKAALEVVTDGRGRQLMDDIRIRLFEFSEEERQKLKDRQDRAHANQSNLVWVMSVGGLLGVLVIVAFARSTAQRIERPVKLLVDGTEAIANGFMDHRLPEMDEDELGLLANSFNVMAQAREDAERVRAHTQEELRNTNQMLLERTDSLQHRNDCVELLGKMAHRLQTSRSDAEFADVVGRFVPKILPGVAGSLYLINNSRNLLEAETTWGELKNPHPHFSPEDCWGLRRGQSHVVEDVTQDVCCSHVCGVTQYTCRPLSAQGDIIGLIYLETAVADTAGDPLSILCENVSLALVNNRLRASLREQSIRDGLTGLFNRRYMDEALGLELARAKRGHSCLSVVMFDVDHFKRFNDTFGHDAGDTLLKAVGANVSDMFRDGDICCRYGGEEFLVILVGADETQALARAEALRMRIAGLEVRHHGQPLSQVTISSGVATYPILDSTPEGLVAAADGALYHAKRTGRDRVVLAGSYQHIPEPA